MLRRNTKTMTELQQLKRRIVRLSNAVSLLGPFMRLKVDDLVVVKAMVACLEAVVEFAKLRQPPPKKRKKRSLEE